MVDKISEARRSWNMSRIRSHDTGPEIFVRKLVYALGYRFRLSAVDLPGKPDLVFRRRHAVIFIHGCFWHQHAACVDGSRPSSNSQYWEPKLRSNIERDLRVKAALVAAGWRVLVVWECETKKPEQLIPRVRDFLEARK
jgi:DNA mismatch endonuclease, patch repair protein